jgi:hypothetical protein
MKRRARRRLAEAIGFVVGLSAVAGVALAASGSEEARAPDAEEIYRVELASYEKALGAWRRDSAVVDSVSRTVDTDSLYRLYRALLTADDPAVAYEEIACEAWRIERRYHERPANAAVRRMLDTVWRSGDADALRELNGRFPAPKQVRIEHSVCGYPGEPVGPPEVNGTSMTFEKPRPAPPRPPKR